MSEGSRAEVGLEEVRLKPPKTILFDVTTEVENRRAKTPVTANCATCGWRGKGGLEG